MKRNKVILSIITVVLIIITGIYVIKNSNRQKASEPSYKTITQETAMKMMSEEKNYIIIDVRTKEEFEGGHIPNAISLPVDRIGDGDIPELPDKNQLIMVYCRSGNRSRQTAEKLAKKGYTDVVDFGGITTWTGKIVK